MKQNFRYLKDVEEVLIPLEDCRFERETLLANRYPGALREDQLGEGEHNFNNVIEDLETAPATTYQVEFKEDGEQIKVTACWGIQERAAFFYEGDEVEEVHSNVLEYT